MAEVLIIDDDPDVRDVMKAALSAAGHQVREAPDGVQGLALVRKYHPALVVTDIVMPKKDGIEIIRELRWQVPNVAILAVSGAVESAFYLHVARQLGADVVLAKPFRLGDVVGAVSDLLNGSQHAAKSRRNYRQSRQACGDGRHAHRAPSRRAGICLAQATPAAADADRK
jgi:DNA-binding response OmpR family regulator